MTRNILIVGITGSGKSALANVLTNTNQFEEGSSGISVTKNFQKSDGPFEWEGVNYYVIDNIGFGDTSNISESDILYNIGRGIYLAKEGINQVLFVFKDKFSQEQINNFNSFKKFVSESKITGFTTLVRTNFEDFRNSQACEQDRQTLLNENNSLREIINSCNGIIHVENPPIPIIEEEDSERQKRKKEEKLNRNKKKRDDSRKIVISHLTENCPEIYKLDGWDSIYLVVLGHIKKIEEIEKEIEERDSSEKKEELKRMENRVAEEIKVLLDKKLTAEIVAAVEYNMQK